jgi:pyruvate dehydrogenase E2 component (dihydrolipoamide acetyltransferase)
MSAELTMPKLSDSMEEATIIRWLKQPGDVFARGEPLAEIETDKATVVYEAETDGVLESIVVPEGGVARTGEPIATLDGHTKAAEPSPPPASERPRATPVARRRAVELGVSLHGLTGTGPGGRITVDDVERAAGIEEAAPAPNGKGAVEPIALTPTQATIAKRMDLASTIPTFVVTAEIDMSAVATLRRDWQHPPVPSVNDFVVRAAALTLRELPAFNSSYVEGRIERYSRVNVGLAVAVEGALLVPVLFDADRKTLAEIAAESRSLAERARDRSLRPDELTNGTFTVTNLGMHGVDSFIAIIDPPQAAILAVGAIRRSAFDADGGGIGFRDALTATLGADHRVVYGADGAAFLAHLKSLLQQPEALL